jgi:hypothetical protein
MIKLLVHSAPVAPCNAYGHGISTFAVIDPGVTVLMAEKYTLEDRMPYFPPISSGGFY